MDGPADLSSQRTPAPADELDHGSGPERARLAAAIIELTAAEAELAAAQAPATRLAAVIADASRLEAELVTLRAADEQRLGLWLADGVRDPRPEPNPTTIEAEKQLASLASDRAAAQAALPMAEQAFRRCADKVRECHRRRDEAICLAAIEAARDFANGYQTALTAALEREAVLHGLRDELLSQGNRPDAPPGALGAAARIGQLIAETKRAAAVRHDPQAAQRLLTALVADPDAQLRC